MLHKVQFIKRSNNLATIVWLDSVEQDFVEIQRFEDVDLQLSSLLVRQLFPSFGKNYSVASVAVVPRDLAVEFLFLILFLKSSFFCCWFWQCSFMDFGQIILVTYFLVADQPRRLAADFFLRFGHNVQVVELLYSPCGCERLTVYLCDFHFLLKQA